MRQWFAPAVLSVTVLFGFSEPSEADFLLNCRLMAADAHSLFRRGCRWETTVRCEPNEPCVVKRQNFISVSAKQALASKPKWLRAVVVHGRTPGTTGGIVGLSTPASASTATATDVQIGRAVGDIGTEVTNTVDRTVAGLMP
jgi:hypothetical protein